MSEGTKKQKLDFYNSLSEKVRRKVFLELMDYATAYDELIFDDDENKFYWEKSAEQLGEKE